jgi:hypothetical protein
MSTIKGKIWVLEKVIEGVYWATILLYNVVLEMD